MRRLCAHVGVDLGDAPVPMPGLEKQAGHWSLDLERRYRDERRARGMGLVEDETTIGLR